MNKLGQTHFHGHYTGDIPFGIWVLIVAIACIIISALIPGLGVLSFIGWVLLVLMIGFIIIAIIHDMNN